MLSFCRVSHSRRIRDLGDTRVIAIAEIAVAGILAAHCASAQTTADLLLQADRLADQGNWFKAAPLYAKAEKEFKLAADPRKELYARFGRLHGEVQAGSYKATRAEVVRNLANPVVEHDAQLKIRGLALLGNIDLNLNTAAALEDWKQVLSLATAAGDRKWQNRANGELGLVAGVNGDIGTAGVALYQAISKADELGDVSGEVHFATWLANGMSVHGMADRALQLLNNASDLARKAGYSEMPLQLSIAKIRAFLLVAEPQKENGRDEAKKLIANTLYEAQQDGILGAQAELLRQSGELAVEEKQFAKAEEDFRKSADVAKTADLPRLEASALLHLSQLYRASGRPQKAASAIDSAIVALQRVEEAYDLPVYLAEKAEVQAALGALDAANALYKQATDLIEGLLVNAQSSRVKTDMIAAMSEIYIGHFRLAWERLHSAAEAFRIIEGARGRALLDSIRYARRSSPESHETPPERTIARLQRTLLQGRLNPSETRKVLYQLDYEYFRLSPIEYTRSRKEMEMLRRPPVSLTVLRKQLAAGESLIEFVLDSRTSYALQVTQAGLTVHILPSRVQIDRLVNQFLSAVRSKRSSTATAERLYQILLAPVMAERPSSLIVVPDGSLHLIPFAALVDGNGTAMNKYLAVEAVPSATVYSMLRNTGQQTKADRPFLGIAYSPAEKEKAQTVMTSRGIFDLSGANLKPLQFGREEIVEAANLLGAGSVTLYGAAASEAALKAQSLRDFRVLHFAAHGVGNEAEPDRAALVLTAGSTAEDGLWQSREIRQSRLNADLVVLSACETGTGRLEGQEGIMNLARAFLIAGAKSVVASLWAVDDRSSATLMGFFYKHLAAGLQVREALRQAQLDFINDYGEKAQPFYWAGFEVIGDGTRRIATKTKDPERRSASGNIR